MRGFVWFLPLDKKVCSRIGIQNLPLLAFGIPPFGFAQGRLSRKRREKWGTPFLVSAGKEMGHPIFGWALEVTNAHGLLAVDRQLRSLLSLLELLESVGTRLMRRSAMGFRGQISFGDRL